jgi:uncharacterized membrane protein YdbT with pleckstrin-like domain
MEESVLYEARPSAKVIVLWFFRSILIIAIFCFFLSFSFMSLLFSAGIYNYITNILLLTALISFVLLVYFFIKWKTYQYKVALDGIYFSGGVLVHKQKYIPFYKVTDVEISQDLLERLLGINSLGFQTAGAGAQNRPEIIFEGLVDAKGPMEITHKHLKNK